MPGNRSFFLVQRAEEPDLIHRLSQGGAQTSRFLPKHTNIHQMTKLISYYYLRKTEACSVRVEGSLKAEKFSSLVGGTVMTQTVSLSSRCIAANSFE